MHDPRAIFYGFRIFLIVCRLISTYDLSSGVAAVKRNGLSVVADYGRRGRAPLITLYGYLGTMMTVEVYGHGVHRRDVCGAGDWQPIATTARLDNTPNNVICTTAQPLLFQMRVFKILPQASGGDEFRCLRGVTVLLVEGTWNVPDGRMCEFEVRNDKKLNRTR